MRFVVFFFAVVLSSVAPGQIISTTGFNHLKISGFGGNGTGWQINSNSIGSTAVTSDVLLLTDNGSFQARSGFRTTQVSWQSGFRASFVYTVSGDRGADGMGFVLQTAGPTALGDSGGSKGYYPITPSVALVFDIYSGNALLLGMNGYTSGGVNVSPLSLNAGNPLLINVSYNVNTMQLVCNMKDQTTGQTFSKTYTVDIKSTLSGSRAYVGFVAATGGALSTQTISNFSFTGY